MSDYWWLHYGDEHSNDLYVYIYIKSHWWDDDDVDNTKSLVIPLALASNK